ncbi:MAG: ATP synthase subunit I [Pseudomonadales bacterium]
MSALQFFKYIGWQLAAMCVLLLAGLGIDGLNGAVAALTGCCIAVLPNTYFTVQAFRYKASDDPVKALSAIYRGGMGKIALVVVLSALAFRFIEFSNPVLPFVAMIIMLMIQIPIGLKVFPVADAPVTDRAQRNEARD